MNYDIKYKRADINKWWGAGRLNRSPKGHLQIGMRKTPELVAYIEAVPAGGYINFSLFEPDGDKKTPTAAPAELDDEILF
jgi:hypothetical protein